MGTKANPGKYDCYAKAEPDEPIFVLLARDEHAPEVVRYWAALKAGVRQVGYWRNFNVSPAFVRKHGEKLVEALSCSDAMKEWRKRYRP